jgi:arylsulfatase A-like enzyme
MMPSAAELLLGLAAALAAGVVDVAIAILQKPRGFEAPGAMAAPIIATTAMLFVTYVAVWMAIRPVVARIRLDRRAVAFALAACVVTAFTLALLVGLQDFEVSPHSLFRAGIILSISAITSAGVYAMYHEGRGLALSEKADAITLGIPVVLLEVLVFEWTEVYAIESVTSAASMLMALGLVVAVVITISLYVSQGGRRLSVRTLAALVLLLAAAPIAGAIYDRRASTLEARSQQPSRVPPRIIVISVDTLRADALSAYRRGAGPTTAIDSIANDGVLFEHATAPSPWTLPSLSSIMSGLLPATHQATVVTSTLSSNVMTLAEYLSGHGYYTAAVVHNDLLNPRNNLKQGFNEYLPLHEQWFANAVGARLLSAAAPAMFPPASWPSNEDQTQIVTDWLETHRDRNFFLWVHYFDPHAPYTPPEKYIVGEPPADIGTAFEGQKVSLQGFFVPTQNDRKWIRSLYDAEVRYIDWNIGRVIATLKRLNLYENSLIVFTSDHGEEFWEHGALGHGHSMYGELLRVPLIVKMPGSTARGRATAVVSTASVTPTILDVAGVHYGADNVDVPSLLPLIDPATGTYVEGPVVSGAQILFDRREAVSFGDFKYIVSRVDGREELFNLSSDPGEQHSIAQTEPGQLEIGRKRLEEQLSRADALRKRLRVEPATVRTDADSERRLRTLGYLK